MSEAKNAVPSPVERVVIPELWMIWDTQDGDEVVIQAADYINFCRASPKDHWGFEVTVLEVGKFRSEQRDVETYDLNLKVDAV